jgi:hypothetical protein
MTPFVEIREIETKKGLFTMKIVVIALVFLFEIF